MRIDHVIYATADLDVASARVEAALGISPVAGGRHEGLGTQNRIVALDGGYLELLAVVDPEEAAGSTLGAAVQARIARDGDGLFGWAVAVADVRPVAARLRTSISTITRAGLSAQLTGVLEAMSEPFLPFFIGRDPGSPDPGSGGDAGGITRIELSGDAARLAHWLGGVDLPVRVVPGTPAVRAVGIGERMFGPR